MKITEVATDGLGVSALIAAAGKLHDEMDDRNVTVGFAEIDGENQAIVLGSRDANALGEAPVVAVTLAKNPRVIILG